MHVRRRPLVESRLLMCERRRILAARRKRSSERKTEGASTQCNDGVLFGVAVKIIRSSSPLHSPSTFLQQVLHMAPWHCARGTLARWHPGTLPLAPWHFGTLTSIFMPCLALVRFPA
jgi:hypothetical protein